MFDDSENRTSNPRIRSGVQVMGDVIAERLSRRGFLRGAAAVGIVAAAGPLAACATSSDALGRAPTPGFDFAEIDRGSDETHHLPDGYEAQIIARWGDPLFPDAPEFDPLAQNAAAQERQFGYNNDYIGFVALDPEEGQEQRGLLCVNHEYVFNTAHAAWRSRGLSRQHDRRTLRHGKGGPRGLCP